MLHYYSLKVEDIKELTCYQFAMYLNKISEIRELFLGSGKSKEMDDNTLIQQAQGLGLTPPRKKDK